MTILRRYAIIALIVIAGLAIVIAGAPPPVVNVLTYHNDLSRSGVNSNETILMPSNVSSATFGKLSNVPLDGAVFGQPLYLSSVLVAGSTRKVVLVATENNTVYAIDATTGAVLWHVNFNYSSDSTAIVGPVPSTDANTEDIVPVIGITSTPVIDPGTNFLYTVSKTKAVSPVNGTSYHQNLHGVNILTGHEAFPTVEITASVRGTCGSTDVTGKNVVFNPLMENQRAALTLTGGIIYIAWGSHSDNPPFNGWVMGYSTANRHQTAVFNTTAAAPATKGCDGGIWMTGGGPSVDSTGNIFLVSSNGNFRHTVNFPTYSQSVLKLIPHTGGMSVLDSFTPYNWSALDAVNGDLGVTDAVLLPDQSGPVAHLLVNISKKGTIYVLNRDNLGGLGNGVNNIVQELDGVESTSPCPSPVFFNQTLYASAAGKTVQAWQMTNGLFNSTPVALSPAAFPFPGLGMSVSSAPDKTNAIVWGLAPQSGIVTTSVLHAYLATTLASVYNSNQAGTRDVPGNYTKYSIPTVANGQVFVGTQNSLAIYGLLPPPTNK